MLVMTWWIYTIQMPVLINFVQRKHFSLMFKQLDINVEIMTILCSYIHQYPIHNEKNIHVTSFPMTPISFK